MQLGQLSPFRNLYGKGSELALLEISRKKPVMNRALREIEGAIVAIAFEQTPMVLGLVRKRAGL